MEMARVERQAFQRLLIVVVCGIVSAEDPGLLVRVAVDAPSYFRVQIPNGVGELSLSVEADRPVAMLVASGYFPSEAHYDFGNFPAWASGQTRSNLKIPVAGLLHNPCDAGEPGAIDSCLQRAASGDGLQCGNAAFVAAAAVAGVASAAAEASAVFRGAAHGGPHAASTSGSTQLFGDHMRQSGVFCEKYVDGCKEGVCAAKRGPATCSGRNASAGSQGDCLCQRGFCQIDGLCIGADLVEPGCMKVTGFLCPHSACPSNIGPSDCEDGLCVCQPGHCAVDGVCQPGSMCTELSHKSLCGASSGATPAWSVLRPPVGDKQTARRLEGPAEDGVQCCRRLDTARTVAPSRFARCLARQFHGVDDALQQGVRVPLLGVDASSPRETSQGRLKEAVIALRVQATGVGGATEIDVRFIASTLGAGLDTTEQQQFALAMGPMQLDQFQTLKELVDPSWHRTHLAPPIIQQLEAPLLWLGIGMSADTPVREVPPSATTLRCRHWQPLVIRVAEERLGEVGVGGGVAPKGGGVLNLHLVGLPYGSKVLYARSWPEPRSLMDFEHATLISQHDGAAVWRAMDVNARYFLIVPSLDVDHGVSAFFALHSLVNAPERSVERPRRPAEFAPSVFEPPTDMGQAQPVADEEPPSSLADRLRSFGKFLLLNAVIAASLFFACWLKRRRRQQAAGASESMQYSVVSSADNFLDVGDAADYSSGDELGEGSRRGAGSSSCASLRYFGGAVKEQLAAGLYSVSTRFGTSRTPAGTNRSFSDDDNDVVGGSSASKGAASFFFSRGASSPLQGSVGRKSAGSNHTEEEAQGLLGSANDADDCDHQRKDMGDAPHTPRRRTMLDDVDVDSMDALLKLRPAARDSIGDGSFDDDEPCASPLVGSERAMYLSR